LAQGPDPGRTGGARAAVTGEIQDRIESGQILPGQLGAPDAQARLATLFGPDQAQAIAAKGEAAINTRLAALRDDPAPPLSAAAPDGGGSGRFVPASFTSLPAGSGGPSVNAPSFAPSSVRPDNGATLGLNQSAALIPGGLFQPFSDIPRSRAETGETGIGSHLAGANAMEPYTVTANPGQTLSEIAYENGVDLNALLAANPNIVNANSIDTGQKINIPANGSIVITAFRNPSQELSWLWNKFGATDTPFERMIIAAEDDKPRAYYDSLRRLAFEND
jgi:LysM repeat protein